MPEPISLSATGFAEFVTSTSRSRESKLRPFKFRNKGEGAGRSSYYRRALNTIRAYHRANGDDNVFIRELADIEHALGGPAKRLELTKLRRNHTAIQAYRRMYGRRKFTILPSHRLACKIGTVTVTAQPDLWVEENGTPVLLKIGMAKKRQEFINVLLFIIRKAAGEMGHRVGARNVVYLDIESGQELCCDDSAGKYRRLFEDGARDIAAVWPTLGGPTAAGGNHS